MVLLNDFARQWAEVGEEATQVFARFGASAWYILGQGVRSFETNLAANWQLPHAVGVASGLDALEIALRALNLQPGQEVLTTPLSAFATTLAILRAGGRPVFCDIDESGLLDLQQAAQAFTAHPNLRFFLPVHLYGFACNATVLDQLQQQFQLQLVEDCAQSIGNGSGLVGHFAATSFYPTKNLGAFGDAGALLTASPELAVRAQSLRDYGQSAKYVHSELGLNSRLDELQAQLLDQVLLPRLASWTARRRQIAAYYQSNLQNPHVTLVPDPSPGRSCWHLFPILAPLGKKAALQAWCRQRGVQTGEHYPLPIPDQPAMASASWRAVGPLPRVREFCQRQLSLPIHPFLTQAELEQVVKTLNEWPGQ